MTEVLSTLTDLISWCAEHHRDDYIVKANLRTAELLRDYLNPPQKGKDPVPVSPNAMLFGMRIQLDEAMPFGRWEVWGKEPAEGLFT